MTKRNSRLGAVLGSLVLVATGVAGPVSPAAAASDKLPDLRMARLADIHLEATSTGRRLLRCDSVVVNVGVGPFEARGARASTSDPTMDVTQRVFDTGGGYRDVAVPGSANGGTEMYFAGDGHTHWHQRDPETYARTRVDDGARVGTGAEHGFCFHDNVEFRTTLPGSPGTAQYPGCGNRVGVSTNGPAA